MIRHIAGRSDPWLLLAVLLLVPFGVLAVSFSTVDGTLHLRGPALRQLLVSVAGVSAMLALARFDYRALRRLSAPAYAAMLLVLLAVLVLGVSEYGARRWIGVGGLTLQPAELAKPLLVLALAAYMAERQPRALPLLVSLGLLGLPCLLVVAQPDTGTALVLIGAWLGAVVAWGAPWRLLGALLGAGVALFPLAFAVAVPDYQRERIAVFLDPARDPLGSGFNLQQAEAALRSGGLFGHGLFGGAASLLDGTVTSSSDFMFAQLGERLGLLGMLLLLAVFGLLLWRGLHAALTAPDEFGRLLAAGLTMMILAQAFMHAAVNLRLFPATGIPLPFVSQGGSSLLAMLSAVGLLQSIAAHRPASTREQWTAQRWR